VRINKRFKNGDISKQRTLRTACSCKRGRKDELQKDGKKLYKTTENILINLYCINFFIVIKKIAKKSARTLTPNNL